MVAPLRLGVFFVAQNLCPKLAGIVPESPPWTKVTAGREFFRASKGFHSQSLDG
jgi:hypothetical protein